MKNSASHGSTEALNALGRRSGIMPCKQISHPTTNQRLKSRATRPGTILGAPALRIITFATYNAVIMTTIAGS